jgi:hypothetical protein
MTQPSGGFLLRYKSLTYTSLAALDMDERKLFDLFEEARDLNGLEGITGLLVFNGTHFLQIIEGNPMAIDDLVERLRRDPRHSGFEIRDQRVIDRRLFENWAMYLVRVNGRSLRAHGDILNALPENLAADVRERVARMAEEALSQVEL